MLNRLMSSVKPRRPRKPRSSRPRTPLGANGKRCYVIGDVHGRFDLLDTLIKSIAADIEERNKNGDMLQTEIVFLGDLIDRGPQSKDVVEFVRQLRVENGRTHLIMGNHEEMLLKGLYSDARLLNDWLRHGGAACAASYGLAPQKLLGQSAQTIQKRLRDTIPESHRNFLRHAVQSVIFGNFFLTHAGVRPEIPINKQSGKDLRWIRNEFLESTADHGFVIVHGHSPRPSVELLFNRIGLDTGAYVSGVLSALMIEGAKLVLFQSKTNETTSDETTTSVDKGPVELKPRAVSHKPHFAAS
ncbi:MAG: metallophosphoesterase [Pseudomonadota bacterium]